LNRSVSSNILFRNSTFASKNVSTLDGTPSCESVIISLNITMLLADRTWYSQPHFEGETNSWILKGHHLKEI
jgi:hypothetical protein